jgi:parallel beta-helix repeat protein
MQANAVVVVLLVAGSALAGSPGRQELAADRPGDVQAATEPATVPGTVDRGWVYEPLVITKPGHYAVVNPIRASGTIVDVRSSHVTLDLNGFVLECTTASSPVIAVRQAAGLEGVVITNGTVRGGNACVHLDRTVRSSLRSLRAAACPAGIYLDDNEALIVEGNQIGSLAEPAPLIGDDCRNCTIRDNTVIGGVQSGISIGYARGGEISGNRVWSSTTCFQIGGEGVRVKGNVASSCGDAMRIDVRFGTIDDNQLSSSETGLTFGVQALDNLYRGNVVRDVTGEPFVDHGRGNVSAGDNFLPGRR